MVKVRGDLFEINLFIKLDLELRFEIVGTEVELDARVLVSDNSLLLIDNRVCEGGIERVEYALGLVVVSNGAI